jgi:predicted anti-sigma-YlaC factor YlaD
MTEHLETKMMDAYAERALEHDQRLLVEQHLTVCSICRERLETLQRMMSLATHLPMEPAPGNLALKVQLRLATLIENRRLAQQLRKLSWLTLIFTTTGLALIGLSWGKLMHLFSTLIGLFDGTILTSVLQALIYLSSQNWSGLTQSSLDLQAQFGQDFDIIVLAGVILLSMAAFAGLARMLLAAQHAFPVEGEE